MTVTVDDTLLSSLMGVMAEVAAAEVLPRFRGVMSESARTKTGPDDLVTDADVAAERALGLALPALLPGVVTPGWGGFIAVAMPLVSIGVSLTLGVWALRHVSAVRLVQAGFAVGALSVVVLALVWGQGALMLCAALIFAGAMGIVQGASFAAIPQLNHTAEDRARASGAVAQLGNLGTTTGTPVLAYLIAAMGPAGVLAFALPLCLLGIALHLWLARRRA